MSGAAKFARCIRKNLPLLADVGRGIMAIGELYGYDLGWLRGFLRQHDRPTRESDTMREIQAQGDQEHDATRKQEAHQKLQQLEQRLEALDQMLEQIEVGLKQPNELQGEQEELETLGQLLGGMEVGGQQMEGKIIKVEGHSRVEEEGREILEEKRNHEEALELSQGEGENTEAEGIEAETQRRLEEEGVTGGKRGQEEALKLSQGEAERIMVEEQKKAEEEKGRIEKEREAVERELKQKKRKFEEERRIFEEEEGRLKHNARKFSDERCVPGEVRGVGNEAVEVEGREKLECMAKKIEGGIQPILWPSREEIRSAKEKTQYSPEKFAFAVAGASGSGKSTLINVFLNSNAAPTGIVETTAEIGRYPDPGDQPPRKGTVWYDIPGAGTLNIPGWQYFNSQGLFVFDLIIVIVGDRFTEIDFDLLENCRRCNIPSFIVRSKADQHIRNMMRESGYESDNGNDEDLRQKCRTHFIAQTRQSIDGQLKSRGLPLQKIYIVSASKEFRRVYSSLNTDSEFSGGLDIIDKRGRFIDELDLIFDLLTTSRLRRCDTTEEHPMSVQQTSIKDQKLRTETPVSAKKSEQPTITTNTLRSYRSEEYLVSRLRTGQVDTGSYLHRNGRRGYPGCHCGANLQDVAHILLKCPLLAEVRKVSRKKLGRRRMTMSDLLYTEEGIGEAVMIWSAFVGNRDVYESGET